MAEFKETDIRHLVKALEKIATELKKIRELKEKELGQDEGKCKDGKG